ncbi:MAG: hypothetical protein CMB73_08090 [Euryarchaeota archaeon]|nr:hypothetical protein [Euryarchaeota archaeon]|tara:strand:+ start:1000 stop:1458 length:459 start_codon:yes stop_codon:yes gene_type:complete
MSVANRELRFRRAGQAIQEALERVSDFGAILVVEGKKDTIALQEFGFPKGSIFEINRGWDLEKISNHLWENHERKLRDGFPSLILLMDWDRTGGTLQKDIKRRLESLDQPVDEKLRRELSICLNPEIKCVEDLVSFKHSIENACGYQFDSGN